MSWDDLVGQEPVKRYLRSVISARRLAHAYLFKGPVGVGKKTAAYIFAQILLCHQPPQPDMACGECKSCRWFKARAANLIEHPDVISLLKFGKGGEETLTGDHEPLIKMETIQHVCEQLHRSPMAGEKRAVIIPEAHRLCRGQAEPANAFLKTLEEPPATSLIIMTSSQPEGLLETIISRVQGVQFRRLSAEEVHLGLTKKGFSGPDAELAASLADGSLGRAIELLGGDLRIWRQAVLNALNKIGPNAAPQVGLMLWALAEQEGKRLFEQDKSAAKQDAAAAEDEGGEGQSEAEDKTESGWKRYVFRRLLEVCEVCFRDAMIVAAGSAPESKLLMQPDQQALSKSLAQKFGAEGCQKALFALREALLAVRLYVRGDVIGRALAGKWVEAQRAG